MELEVARARLGSSGRCGKEGVSRKSIDEAWREELCIQE